MIGVTQKSGVGKPFNWSLMTDDLKALLEIAPTQIQSAQKGSERFDYDFMAILLAFLIASDPISLWFQSYVRTAQISDEFPGALKRNSSQRNLRTSNQSLSARSWTTSTQNILFEATNVLRETTLEDQPFLDACHLMGAYIYHPGTHRTQLEEWGFHGETWSKSFLSAIKSMRPKEYDKWVRLHQSIFDISTGLETRFAADQATSRDTLGYEIYAYALYRFLTHPESKAPLTISILAPWGAGKSSLMKMIHKRLNLTSPQKNTNPTEKLNLKEVNIELREYLHNNPPTLNFLDKNGLERKQLTVWFNVWDYQNAEEVWGGLAGAIVREITWSLSDLDQQKFALSLSSQKMDASQILQIRQAASLWHRASRWMIVIAGAIVGSGVLLTAEPFGIFQGAGILGLMGPLLIGLRELKREYDSMAKPAGPNVQEYLKPPDYTNKLGFLHHVEKDMRQIVKVFPHEIVIFIDDLDRCAPRKVATIFEALNLFLREDFPGCKFVISMDPELVTASLENAYSELADKLPDAETNPLGWSFMDKFVQFPFMIPQPEVEDVEHYTKSLLSSIAVTMTDHSLVEALKDAPTSFENVEEITKVSSEMGVKHGLDENQVQLLAHQLIHREKIRIMDDAFDKFTDDDPQIRKAVLTEMPDFSTNPRELKRFLNVYRFFLVLLSLRQFQNKPVPTQEQLRRWIRLYLKAPQFVHWLQRAQGSANRDSKTDELRPISTMPTGAQLLALFEQSGAVNTNWEDWRMNVRTTSESIFHMNLTKERWMLDNDVPEFFLREGQLPMEKRLSTAAGKGFW